MYLSGSKMHYAGQQMFWSLTGEAKSSSLIVMLAAGSSSCLRECCCGRQSLGNQMVWTKDFGWAFGLRWTPSWMSHDRFGEVEVLLLRAMPAWQSGCKSRLWQGERCLLDGSPAWDFLVHFQICFTGFQSLNQTFLWELGLTSQTKELWSGLHT